MDRGMAEKPAGACPRRHRAPAVDEQPGGDGSDSLSHDPQTERLGEGWGRRQGCAVRCRMGERAWLLVLALSAVVLLASCREKSAAAKVDPLSTAYGVEQDWNDPQHVIPLNYQQAQGKRVFYTYCVWCHADSTPAGPSNRSNLTPAPPLANDGSVLNSLSDELLRNTITLGGSAMGKSAMMSPWGRTLTQDEVQAVIAFMRAIAQPPYKPPALPGPRYSDR